MHLGDPVRAYVQYDTVLQHRPEDAAARRGLAEAEGGIRLLEQQPSAFGVSSRGGFAMVPCSSSTGLPEGERDIHGRLKMTDRSRLEEAMAEERAYWGEAARVSGEAEEVAYRHARFVANCWCSGGIPRGVLVWV